jgi:transposase-like protein
MKIGKKASVSDGFVWRCPNKNCKSTRSLREGSMFSKSKLTLQTLLRLIYYWSTDSFTIRKIKEETEVVSDHTVVEWNKLLRNVCVKHVQDYPMKFGGSKRIVEADEAKFGKNKYNRGRLVQGKWVFGLFDRESGNVYLERVDKRDSKTLIPIIKRVVKKRSIICTDEWRAYRPLVELLVRSRGIRPQYNRFTHRTVSHSRNFINRQTGAHTQNIERTWLKVRCKFKRMQGAPQEYFDSYLSEYMWKRNVLGIYNNRRVFSAILEEIKNQYPL